METYSGLSEADVKELFAGFATDQQIRALNLGFAVTYPDNPQDTLQDNPQDKAMLGLLKKDRPIRLGMPAYLVDALIHDSGSRYNAAILMGEDPNEGRPFIDTYRDLEGYQFSWGVLTQQDKLDVDEAYLPSLSTSLCTHFGFSFEFALHVLPRPELWRTVTRLYRFSELTYEPEEETMEMTLLEFGSDCCDQSDRDRLRMWLAREFIPQHLPGLVHYLCLWLFIHHSFPAIFDRIVETVSTGPDVARDILNVIGRRESSNGTSY